GFFEKQKLTGPNFIDWYRQLKIVLSIKDELNYLEQPIPLAPVAPAGQQVAPEILAALNAWIKGSKEITLFAQQAEHDLLQTTRDFHSCRQEEEQSVSSYVLKMNGYIDNLERLGHPMGKIVNELHAMLKLHEQTLPKNNAPALNDIRAGKVQKAELLKKKKNAASGAGGSSIFIIELNTILNSSWIYDTGCGTHICNTTQGLRASRKLKLGALSLYIGNGQREVVEAIGAFYLCLPSGLETVLNNYQYAPSITRGVISVFSLYEDGFINHFMDNTIQVSRNNMVYFSSILRDGIFEIDLSNSPTNESSIYALSNKRAKLDLDSTLLWHCRLGHISKKCIEKLQNDGLLDSSDLKAFEKCVSCMSGKMARKPYTHQVKRAKDLLGLIHTDVCGPFKIMSRQGASYFVTFTNDFSRYGYVYLLKHKHEVFETFKVFQKEVESQLERRNRTLLDMVRSMMSQTTLHKSFWDYALETAARILNMVPTKKVEKTPYEVWHGKAPKLSYLKVLGCEALVKRDTLTKPDKLEPRSIKCIFVGYPKETMGYSFYYPPDKVLVGRNAEFLENSLINQEASGSLEDLKIIQEEDMHPSIDTNLNHEKDDLEIDEPQKHELGDLGEPTNYKAALLDPKSEKWLNAINVEMKSMKYNEVRILVELPPNGKTIGSKWLFKKKTDMDGNVHTYKARLVEKGYTQTPGIDYEETFSPIADIRAIMILIARATYYDYEIWQWNKRFDDEIKKFGFTQNRDEPCVYLKASGSEAAYILRIMIYRDRSRWLIGLCQSAYIEKILKRYCMENSKCGSIPMQEKLKLSKSQGDIHWTTVKNILKYLRNTKDMFLLYEEAEYIAAFDASKEAVWVRKFISGLGVVPIIEQPISMYCDNTGAIAIANESGITKGSRHFVSKFTTFEKLLNMVI
nr:hypothetical protein [Tanacetum cinerariifolium]